MYEKLKVNKIDQKAFGKFTNRPGQKYDNQEKYSSIMK